MKKYYFLSLLLLFLVSCNKKGDRTLVDETKNLIPFNSVPSHCYNNVMDEDELDVDCGGSCIVCTEAKPTCTLDVNRAMVNNSPKIITNITKSILSGNVVKISFSAGSMPCEIRFKEDFSKIESFEINSSASTLQDKQMSLKLSNPVYNYLVTSTYTDSGLGFINSSENGQYEVYICNSTYSSNNYPISIHLLVP